jgi:hypothetical protein
VYRQAGSVNNPKLQKKWLPANFRLSIAGLEEPCTRVNKVEALVVKQSIVNNADGQSDFTVDIPNLVITLPESVAQPFIDWHQSFVIDGKNSDDDERNGSLTYLATDGTILGQLTFQHLGIIRAANDPTDQTVRRVKAEMYCENMVFKLG